MRILFATGIYPPEIGGPATYTQTMADQFSRLGHHVVVVTYARTVLPSSRFHIVAVSRGIVKGIRHAVYFFAILRHGLRSDLIFAQDPVSAGFPALCAARILHKRFAVRIAGDYAWEQGMGRFGVMDLLDEFLKKRYDLRVELLRRVEARVARSAAIVIVPSEYLRSVLIQWGVEPSRVRVVYNAVEKPVNVVPKTGARARLGVSGHVLVSAGRLVPWKGFSLLVRLMPQITKDFPDAKLYIIGSGPEEHRLTKEVHALRLTGQVFFTGVKSKSELELYLSSADAFLLNTGYEGFSHQLLEVMLVGVPVVTTSSGGNREIVRDGVNALVAEYNNLSDWQDCVRRLMKDEDLQRRLVKAGIDTGARFSLGRMVEETIVALGI